MVNALPTTNNLIKRKIKDVNPYYCSMCNTHRERLAHLFRECQVTQRIRRSTIESVATQESQQSIQEWIRNFLNLFKKKKHEEGKGMETEFISTLWGIWIHINELFSRKSS